MAPNGFRRAELTISLGCCGTLLISVPVAPTASSLSLLSPFLLQEGAVAEPPSRSDRETAEDQCCGGIASCEAFPDHCLSVSSHDTDHCRDTGGADESTILLVRNGLNPIIIVIIIKSHFQKDSKPLVSVVAGATAPILKAVAKSAPNAFVLPIFGYPAKPEVDNNIHV
uniref:2-keto-3-deoxy-6-phosphogluconate aldolase n=1 Tax=Brugia timori TaxID=42155 RepID=A0A0R3RCR7_9BILA